MGESTVRKKSKSKSRAQHASSNSESAMHHSQNLSSFYSAGPALSLIQKKVAIGKAGDSYEREADAVSKRVAAAQPAPQISRMPAGGIGREEIKKPEETAKPVQKQEIKKPEEAAKTVQKEEVKKPEEAAKPIQREEIKKPEDAAKTVQKEEIKKPEETTKTIQKEEIKKPEEAAKPVQRQETKKPEEAAIQKQEEEVAQTKEGTGGTASPSMESAASHAIGTKGPGQPLSPSTQGALESRMGADFSDVRVHNDNAAHEAASALNARAFTHQNDVWLGKGESQDDLRLMAHEATHVVQQSGRGQGEVQRAKKDNNETGKGEKCGDFKSKDKFLVDEDNKIITFKSIRLPDFKAEKRYKKYYEKHKLKLRRDKRYKRGTPDQTKVWDESIDKKNLKDKFKELGVAVDSKQTYALRHSDSNYHIIGNPESLVELAKRPIWDRKGVAKPKDVDHIVELQLSGWVGKGGSEWPNKAGTIEQDGNMELMDSRANQDSGNRINMEILSKIGDALNNWPGQDDETDSKNKTDKKKKKKAPSEDTIKTKYDLVFCNIQKGLGDAGEPENYWEWEEINAGKHLNKFELAKEGPKGNKWMIFPSSRGGQPQEVKPGKKRPAEGKEKKWFEPLLIDNIDLKEPGEKGENIGTITLNLSDKAKKKLKPRTVDRFPDLPIPVKRLDAPPNAGYLVDEKVMEIWRIASIKGLSPINISSWDILPDKGFLAYGTINPDIPFFKKEVGIDLIIEGPKIEFRKVFDTGDFSPPGPLKVTSSALEVFAGTEGIGIRGEALFEVEKLGSGRIGAGAGITLAGESSFAIDGEFNFDTELFDKANIQVWYRNNKFGGKGELEINKEGKIRGIKYAHAIATFEEDRINASGTVKPVSSWIEQGDMNLSYSEAEGLMIAGSLQLKKGIKGIKSGILEAKVVKKPGEERYRLGAHGKLESDIPGINAMLDVAYDDGIFDANVTTAFEKGMLKGSVTIGATNRPVSKEGQPGGAPDERSDKITIYGGGSVTVRIAPWLQGTAGIRLLPNGEVEIVGSIGLPESLEIFPEKKLEKNLFKIGIDIPIIGFSVVGQRVGIFATISGGLDLNAGIGPAQLRELGLAITYNPSHEEQTQVKGGAKLFIPAHAGIRLFVRGALGAGIPIVSAQAGLELGGSLGIEAAVSAGVQVEWTPAKGLVLDALAEAYAEPKFKFDITGFVLVEADLLFSTIELYNKRWQLAAVEYGSGLRFGVKLPVHYEEGKSFDISMDQVQFEVPQIEPKEIFEGLIKRIV